MFFEEILKLDEEWKNSEYVSVQRWLRSLQRKGSFSTMKAYFKLLAWFVQFVNLSPDDFIKLPKDEIVEMVQAFCDKWSDEGKKSTALNAMKALRSFLKANKFKVEELDLDASYKAMKRPEYVPTKEEVYKMASVCDLKWRAIILCLFQSGLRNSALRALTYGMLKDQIESGVIPIRVHVTSDLRRILPDACKEDVDYWTFFGAEASEALRQYINWRKEKYGGIQDDELLFPSESRSLSLHERLREPISQWHLTRIVKKAAKKAGIKGWRNVRAHSLRKTFRAVLDMGYVDGGQMAEDDKEYLMGHRLPGAKAPYHNANVELLAQRYMRLNWAPAGQMTKEARIEMIKAFAKTLGIENIEVKIQKVREKQPELDEMEVLGRIIREELGIKPLESRIVKRRNEDIDCDEKPYRSKIIEEKELVQHVEEGWEIVRELRNGKFLIRKQNY